MSTHPSSDSDRLSQTDRTADRPTGGRGDDRRDDYSRRFSETDTSGGRERVVPLEVQLRKFHRDSQQNGILSEIKRRRFSEKPLSRRKKRESAIRKAARRRIRYGY